MKLFTITLYYTIISYKLTNYHRSQNFKQSYLTIIKVNQNKNLSQHHLSRSRDTATVTETATETAPCMEQNVGLQI